MNKSKQINKEADTKKKGRRGKYQFLCLLSRGQPVIDATLEIKLQRQKFRSANAAEKRKIPERKHPEKIRVKNAGFFLLRNIVPPWTKCFKERY